MKFTDAYSLISEHHGDDFNPELLKVSLNKLLDVLGKDKDNESLYKNLESWITDNQESLL